MAMLLAPAGACAQGTFLGLVDIGVTGGHSWFDYEDANPAPELLEASGGNANVGVEVRYTLPVFKAGTFIGLQAAWRKETARLKARLVEQTPRIMGSTDASYEPQWTADLLARLGHDFGRFSIYASGGLSVIDSQVQTVTSVLVLGANVPVRRKDKDSQYHLGWKAALGADIELHRHWLLFLEAEYADLGTEKYFESRVGNLFERSLKNYGGRGGILYRF